MPALYRNWKKICEVGYGNQLLMLVLASIKIDENDPIFIGLYTGFPECFSGEENLNGPFPLSVLRSLGGEAAVKAGKSWDDGADHPDSYEVTSDLSVPTILFQVDDEHVSFGVDWPFFPLPLLETLKLKQGDTFDWHGKRLFILDCRFNEKFKEYTVVATPIECIAPQL